MHIKEFGHIFWGTPQPVIILTDNKSVTRFFQTKIIPPPLWNACDFVIQFNFIIAHIPGNNNTAADYLSRMEMDPTEKLVLKIREDVETRPIEVNVQSAGVSEEDITVHRQAFCCISWNPGHENFAACPWKACLWNPGQMT